AVVAFPSPLASAVHEIAESPAIADEPAAIAEIEAAISEPEMPFEAATEAVAAELSQEEADAQDEAVLDLIAVQMAAPDPDEEHDFPIVADSEPAHVTTPPIVEPLSAVAPAPTPELPPVAPLAPALQPMLSASPSVAQEAD